MRIFHRYVLLKENRKLLATLDRLGIRCAIERRQFGDLESVTGEFFLYEDDAAYAEKTRALEAFDLLPQEGTEVSREEEESAEWHQLNVGQSGYPQPEDDWFARVYGVEGTCPTCRYHERQVAPFRFRCEPKAKHSQFLGLNGSFEPIFVRDRAKAMFEEERIGGVRFSRPVLHRTGAPLESIWQLEIDVTLPGGLRIDNLVAERCEEIRDPEGRRFLAAIGSSLLKGPFCGRMKHNHPTRGLVAFDARALAGAPEVVRTQELFGSGGCADRLTIVSRRVRQAIERHRLRGVQFRPVKLA